MNKIFADHVTNTAFFLSVSRRQVMYLMHYYDFPWVDACKHDHCLRYTAHCRNQLILWDTNKPDSAITTRRALASKGLVEEIQYPDGNDRFPDKVSSYYRLTEAGRLTCLLLIEAGLAVANTDMKKAAND